MKKLLLFLLCLCLSLCIPACGQDKPEGASAETSMSQNDREREEDERVGRFRQDLSTNFTLSDEGIYCVREELTVEYDEEGTPYEVDARFLLYCDNQSDTFIKACGRPDCRHNDHTCDAWLSPFTGIVYSDGKSLYYIDRIPGATEAIVRGRELNAEEIGELERLPAALIRMDEDGKNRTKIADLYPAEEKGYFTGSRAEVYSLGYVQWDLCHSENEEQTYVNRYGAIEDSAYLRKMADPEPEDVRSRSAVNTVGQEIYYLYSGSAGDDPDESIYNTIYKWDPAGNTMQKAGEVPAGKAGCYREEGAYYAENGEIKRWDYETHAEETLLDTGFNGADMVYGFPDCLMIMDRLVKGKDEEEQEAELRFYDWDLKELGTCRIPLEEDDVFRMPDGSVLRQVLWGETEERILFCKHWHVNVSVPAYYIEKSDFGTGEIRLHEYHFPEE